MNSRPRIAPVIPANAGIHFHVGEFQMGSRFRGNDLNWECAKG